MKKLFISVPMRNRTEYAIKASMEQMHKIAEAVFGEELEVIPTYFEENPPENTNMALWYLGESIKKLSEADRFIGIYDEDKLMGLEFNRPLYNADAQMYDYVVGTFLIVGLTEDDFGSLSDEMIEKYTSMFRRCYGLLEDEDGKRYMVCMKPKQ